MILGYFGGVFMDKLYVKVEEMKAEWIGRIWVGDDVVIIVIIYHI
jgi:hypothetical protein